MPSPSSAATAKAASVAPAADAAPAPPKKMAKPRTAARTTAARRAAAKGAPLPDDHTESEAVAHAIRAVYSDLAPSINRIMNAGLHEAGQLHAICLFRDSLAVTDDPNRDPAVAIEAGRTVAEAPES